MSKYLFLDVDGVLNSEAFYTEISQNDRMLKIHKENPSMPGQMIYKLSNFDPKAVDGNADAISACCRGRSKTSKNFIWKYE